MTMPSLVWGSPQWWTAAAILAAVAFAPVLWSYRGTNLPGRVRLGCAFLKGLAIAALALSLVEPMLSGTRPRKGANTFVVLTDNSQSLKISDEPGGPTRGDWIQKRLGKDAPWMTRLGQDFDLRRYVFDSHLRGVDGFDHITFDGNGSALNTTLDALTKRYRGLPLAGVLLLTDGLRTDAGNLDHAKLPPIYPVVPPSRKTIRDVGVGDVTVSQTNFEAAPVVARADVRASGYAGQPIVAIVSDESGKELERQEATAKDDGRPLGFRFQFRPEKRGINIFRVSSYPASEAPPTDPKAEPTAPSTEQTLANNGRLFVGDQGGGPYRVLYVSGRPNWEFKFLRRAINEDEQVQIVGLLRIAKRQPKFDFRDPRTKADSQLFKNFDNTDDTTERADQPVLVRLGTADEVELRDGFPKTAEDLFKYHAVVIDDLEAEFFTQDQLTLLRNFVSMRGGGLLMLGGPDAFSEGHYDRTPVSELLPVYVNRVAPFEQSEAGYRLLLTREGWLQPWVRTRRTEEDEGKRLAAMPPFQTLSRISGIKPGAEILAEVSEGAGANVPALVAQTFGKGHVAALLVGDFWRWGIKREKPEETDFDRAWRQTVRWLVSDVPGRVDVALKPKDAAGAPAVDLTVRVRDAEYRPLDNAGVTIKVKRPEGDELSLPAEPDARESGTYHATYVTRQPGAYRFTAAAAEPDGNAIGEREAGWAAQPMADEFARLEPDRAFLAELAAKTKGEVVDGDRLEAFVAGLPARGAPITEPWTAPLWHQPWYFLVAILALAGEWGLRRVHGLS